jgi:prevent-host-death family protein
MSTVGIRALQQHASAVVNRVVAGEAVEITDRGRPVARLVPLTPSSPLETLIGDGLVRQATRAFADLAPLPAVALVPDQGTRSLGEILEAMRADER